jgi:fumarylpyruvate hydrolase
MLNPAITVRGQGALQSFRIFCLTTNYAAHAKEMGTNPEDRPYMFLKPPTALLPVPPGGTGTVAIPAFGKELHHEVEMVLAVLGDGGLAFGVGLDLTLRDVQKELKAKGRPWLLSKGWDRSGPVSEFVHRDEAGDWTGLSVRLEVNGVARQEAPVTRMTLGVPQILEFVGGFSPLRTGDLIFTGTPEGIGPLLPGDTARAALLAGKRELTSLVVKIG